MTRAEVPGPNNTHVLVVAQFTSSSVRNRAKPKERTVVTIAARLQTLSSNPRPSLSITKSPRLLSPSLSCTVLSQVHTSHSIASNVITVDRTADTRSRHCVFTSIVLRLLSPYFSQTSTGSSQVLSLYKHPHSRLRAGLLRMPSLASLDVSLSLRFFRNFHCINNGLSGTCVDTGRGS